MAPFHFGATVASLHFEGRATAFHLDATLGPLHFQLGPAGFFVLSEVGVRAFHFETGFLGCVKLAYDWTAGVVHFGFFGAGFIGQFSGLSTTTIPECQGSDDQGAESESGDDDACGGSCAEFARRGWGLRDFGYVAWAGSVDGGDGDYLLRDVVSE